MNFLGNQNKEENKYCHPLVLNSYDTFSKLHINTPFIFLAVLV